MRRFRLLPIISYGTPLFVGACFAAAARLPRLAPDGSRATVVWACVALATIVTAVASFLLATRVTRPRDAVRMAFTPTLLVAAAFGTFLFVERDITRIAVALGTAGLLGAHSVFVAGMRGVGSRYRSEDLRHLVFALRVVACFFAFAFAFTLPTISMVHPAVAAVVTGLLAGIVAWETLHDEAFSAKPPALLAFAFAALGAEFYVGLSALPVSAVTSAAVGLILYVCALMAATFSLRGATLPRRNYFIAFSLVTVVLATARWT